MKNIRNAPPFHATHPHRGLCEWFFPEELARSTLSPPTGGRAQTPMLLRPGPTVKPPWGALRFLLSQLLPFQPNTQHWGWLGHFCFRSFDSGLRAGILQTFPQTFTCVRTSSTRTPPATTNVKHVLYLASVGIFFPLPCAFARTGATLANSEHGSIRRPSDDQGSHVVESSHPKEGGQL